MGNTITIANVIDCQHAEEVENYINEEVPKKLENYTCTLETVYSDSDACEALVILCTGEKKQSYNFAP